MESSNSSAAAIAYHSVSEREPQPEMVGSDNDIEKIPVCNLTTSHGKAAVHQQHHKQPQDPAFCRTSVQAESSCASSCTDAIPRNVQNIPLVVVSRKGQQQKTAPSQVSSHYNSTHSRFASSTRRAAPQPTTPIESVSCIFRSWEETSKYAECAIQSTSQFGSSFEPHSRHEHCWQMYHTPFTYNVLD